MNPPSKEMCLYMAEKCYDTEFKRLKELSWYWLICWVAYDDWIELYWDKE